MVEWANLGRCTNSCCQNEGSCNRFYPEDGEVAVKDLNALPLICLCGCRGNQHTFLGEKEAVAQPIPAATANPATEPARAAPATAPMDTPSKGDPPTATFKAFLDASKLRNERRSQASNPGPNTAPPKMAFDASSKIHQQQWTQQTNQADKKRKTKNKRGTPPPAKRTKSESVPPKAAKLLPTVKWNLTIFPITSAFKDESSLIVQPREQDMDSFSFMGYCRIIELPRDPSSYEIYDAVFSAFCTAGIPTMRGWRLLFRQGMGRGTDGALRLNNTGSSSLSLLNLQQACAKYHAPQYLRTIFVILAAGGPDLPLDKHADFKAREYKKAGIDSESERMSADDDKSDSDSQSCKSSPKQDDLNGNGAKTSDARSPLFMKSETPPIEDQTFHKASTPENSEEEYDIADFKIMSSAPMLDRLSINVSGPDVGKKSDTNWWPHRMSGAYSNILALLSPFEGQVEAIKAQTMFDSDKLVSLVSDTINTLRPSFHFLFDLKSLKEEDPDDFLRQLGKDFCLGPHGLGRVIDHLYQLYLLLTNYFQRRAMSRKVVLACIEQMNVLAAPLLDLLIEFRGSMFRGLYDPRGISDFQDVLRKRRNYFADADAGDRLRVLKLRLEYDSVDMFRDALFQDFGSVTDYKGMQTDNFFVGPDGLDGLLCLIEQVVDVFPTQDPRYPGLMNLFTEFCEILAKRILNVSKSSGKKKQRSTSQNTDSKGYNTRSAHQPGEGNVSDISSSDSEASSVFEYEPSSKEKKKFRKSKPAADFDFKSDLSSDSDCLPTSQELFEEMFPPRPRPRTEYPKSESRREYTSTHPPPPKPKKPSPPPARPRPKPHPKRPTAAPPPPPTQFERLMTMSLDGVMREIVRKCPDRTLTWEWFIHEYPKQRDQRRHLLLRCHPDKNVNQPQHWRDICEDLTKVLNVKKGEID